MIDCDHCNERIDSDDRFMELQPCHFMYDGNEMTRENMSWTVHLDCIVEFAEKMGVDK